MFSSQNNQSSAILDHGNAMRTSGTRTSMLGIGSWNNLGPRDLFTGNCHGYLIMVIR